MSVDDQPSNPTDNRPFVDVLGTAISRRNVMKGGAAAAATLFIAPHVANADYSGDDYDENWNRIPGSRNSRVRFEPTPNPGGPDPMISPDYEYTSIIPWGTPLFPGVPEIDPTDVASNGSANQEQQVGIGHDGIWFFPDVEDTDGDGNDDWKHNWDRRDWDYDDPSNTNGVLCLNHEFGFTSHVLGKPAPENLEDVRTMQAAHGVTCVEIAKGEDGWKEVVPSSRNRRITPNTPVEFTGPAAGSPLLETPSGSEPAGTLNNCGSGYTPWGTYLTCEENFNGYYGYTDEAYEVTPEQERYGFTAGGFGYGWYQFDERWDISNPNSKNDENRFGWIVEIDPNDPGAKPKKRTALGRVKHEGCAIAIGRRGRVVAYMGDDQRFDYIYKFVSAGHWQTMLAEGKSPLDEGTLYVARFDDDFTGEWLELSPNNPVLADWTLDECLVYTRLAADAVGATPMDRPEWTTIGRRQEVYCTLTNNSRRTEADAANPQAPNLNGHIIRWRDTKRHTGTDFRWDIYVLSDDTLPENGGDESYSFASPDGLWADPTGRLFIGTDGRQPFGNNQLVVADTRRDEFRRLFAGVDGDEITGTTVTPDRRTMFINMQHPGNGDPTRTNFPVPGAGGPEVPRDSTIVITRKNGGTVGS